MVRLVLFIILMLIAMYVVWVVLPSGSFCGISVIALLFVVPVAAKLGLFR